MFFNGLYKYASNCQQQENISKCYIKDKYLEKIEKKCAIEKENTKSKSKN